MADPAASPFAAVLTQPALQSWGRAVGEAAARGEIALPLVVMLRGPLGAGKSVLARSIARGAGVATAMPSPTYNLRFSYETGGVVVHHMDLYRLEDPDDVWELGWEEIGQAGEIVLIEWPERAESLLPPDRWEIRLGMPDDGPAAGDPGLRAIRVEAVGDAPDPPPLPPSNGSGGSGGSSGASAAVAW